MDLQQCLRKTTSPQYRTNATKLSQGFDGLLRSVNISNHRAVSEIGRIRLFTFSVMLYISPVARGSRDHFMRRSALSVIALTCLLQGCITPYTTAFPSLSFMPAEYERREAQIHDPFPDINIGPDTGNRPPGFTQQRSETLRAQDRYFAALRRQQSGAPFPALDARPRTTGVKYPAAVER